jgi:hypothetical protein
MSVKVRFALSDARMDLASWEQPVANPAMVEFIDWLHEFVVWPDGDPEAVKPGLQLFNRLESVGLQKDADYMTEIVIADAEAIAVETLEYLRNYREHKQAEAKAIWEAERERKAAEEAEAKLARAEQFKQDKIARFLAIQVNTVGMPAAVNFIKFLNVEGLVRPYKEGTWKFNYVAAIVAETFSVTSFNDRQEYMFVLSGLRQILADYQEHMAQPTNYSVGDNVEVKVEIKEKTRRQKAPKEPKVYESVLDREIGMYTVQGRELMISKQEKIEINRSVVSHSQKESAKNKESSRRGSKK